MLLPPLAPRLNLHTIQQSPFQVLIYYVHANKSSMRCIELIRLDSAPYLEYLRRRQRDHVWD